MRKQDIPLLEKAIDEAVMTAIHEMEVPRSMIGGHEQPIDLPKFFHREDLKPVFIAQIIEFLSERRLFAVYDAITTRITISINFAVCQMTTAQCRAFNQKFLPMAA